MEIILTIEDISFLKLHKILEKQIMDFSPQILQSVNNNQWHLQEISFEIRQIFILIQIFYKIIRQLLGSVPNSTIPINMQQKSK